MEPLVTLILYLFERVTVEHLDFFRFVLLLLPFTTISSSKFFVFLLFLLLLGLHQAVDVFGDELLQLEGQILLYVVVGGAKHAEVVVGGEADRFNLLVEVVSHWVILLDFNLVLLHECDGSFVLRARIVRLSGDHAHFI